MKIYVDFSELDKDIIWGVLAYIEANRSDYVSSINIIQNIYDRCVTGEPYEENKIDVLKLKETIEQILMEEWDEFSIIAGYSIMELQSLERKLKIFLS